MLALKFAHSSHSLTETSVDPILPDTMIYEENNRGKYWS